MADMVVNFKSNLESILKATDRTVKKATEEIGMAAETHAKLYVTEGVYKSPQGWYVRTGNLRNSISHDTEDGGYTAVVGSSVEYAPYVELGTGVHASGDRMSSKMAWSYLGSDGNWHRTSGMPPRPFIRPSIENHVDEYKKILEDVLSER